jgi:hypothetical protein
MWAYSSYQSRFAITEEEPGFSSPSIILCVSIPTQNYTEIHRKIWQTERAEEQTLCRSCAVSLVCDTHTHTKHAALWGHTYEVRIIQLFALRILCLTSSKALPGTQSGDKQITERSGNIPEIYWTDWGKQKQITVRLEFEFHKNPVDHDIR